MMQMKIKKLGALLVSAVLCAGMAAPAFAFEGEATPVEQPILPEVVEDVVTITDETSGALTPEGNLTLVDDYHTNYSDGSGQQFITLVSKSGNTFYLVIDRNAKGQQTVHFMNLVDEADLLALMEEEDADAYTAEKEAAAQAEQDRLKAEEEAKKAAEEAAASGTEQPKENKVTKIASGFLGVVVLIALAAGGGFYVFANGKATTAYRDLNEFQTFIRYPVASEIVKKVKEDGELTLDKVVSSRKPFGLATTAKPMKTGDVILRYNGGRGPYKRTEIRVGTEMIDQWKIIISRLTAEHAGQPAKDGKYRVLSTMELLKPGEICSETYLVAGAFDSKEEATNYMDYLKTQFVRFLILQIAMTQQLSKASFAFVPCQDFTRKWTDKQLFEKYGLSSEEVNYIQGMIKEMA